MAETEGERLEREREETRRQEAEQMTRAEGLEQGRIEERHHEAGREMNEDDPFRERGNDPG